MKIFNALPTIADEPIALTIGNFDGVHRGHQAMIARLKAAAHARDLPACLLTFDPHPREYFHPMSAPARITSLTDKARLLKMHGIDRLYVCPFDAHIANMPAEPFVRDVLVSRLGVEWLLVGQDFRFGAGRQGDRNLLTALAVEQGYEFEAMEPVLAEGTRVSSTAVRAALARGDMAQAVALLGHNAGVAEWRQEMGRCAL